MGIKVSVITINFNNLQGLKPTFESVINQDFVNIEYLLIDGGSTDGSREFILANAKMVNFWLSEKDSGVYEAMNKGIMNSSGDYLIFLNSGDIFSGKDSISKLISSSEEEDLVFGNILVEDNDKSWIKKYNEKLNFRYFYFESIPHPACLISRKLFDQIGLYDTSLKIVSDWKFFLLAVVKNNCSYRYVDQVISTFSLGGLSSMIKNVESLEYERRSTLKKYFLLEYLAYSLYLKVIRKSIYKKL
jgi:glycosyltransferase involved in cell wall biosynthesis